MLIIYIFCSNYNLVHLLKRQNLVADIYYRRTNSIKLWYKHFFFQTTDFKFDLISYFFRIYCMIIHLWMTTKHLCYKVFLSLDIHIHPKLQFTIDSNILFDSKLKERQTYKLLININVIIYQFSIINLQSYWYETLLWHKKYKKDNLKFSSTEKGDVFYLTRVSLSKTSWTN